MSYIWAKFFCIYILPYFPVKIKYLIETQNLRLANRRPSAVDVVQSLHIDHGRAIYLKACKKKMGFSSLSNKKSIAEKRQQSIDKYNKIRS